MLIKQYSYDDAIYYKQLRDTGSRTDNLVVGLNCLSQGENQVYLAVTTKYISMIDEDNKTIQFELSKLVRLYDPDPRTIVFEYSTLDGNRNIKLKVSDSHTNARAVVEEVHQEIGNILAKL